MMIEFNGQSIPISLAEVADPNRAVLLVWDMQNDQAGSSFNKQEFLRATPPLIAAAKSAGVRTVYAYSTPYQWRDESPAMIRRAMKDQGVSDTIIEKHRATMFLGTEFEQLLANWNKTTIVMVGCRTDAGIEGTARDGYYRGYSMIVVRDCVGTGNVQSHLDALKRLERFSDVVSAQELLEIWGAGK
jgi:nicotinamidase-related amidase